MTSPGASERIRIPRWLHLFTIALMGSACGINAVFVALAIPALAPFGLKAFVAAGVAGMIAGILPAYWLASRIAAGIAES